jgi:multiple sugar transport system permease protein
MATQAASGLRPPPRHRRRRTGASKALRLAILVAWALVCLVPMLWFLSIGLRPRTEIVTRVPIYWPTWSLDAWHVVWRDWPMWSYLRNSVLAILGSVVIDLVLAIPAAYALARYRFRGREDIGFYILSTRMMAPAVVAIPIFFLFKTLGLLDTVWALMLVYAAMNLSLVTWIIRSYMLEVPHEIEDAARTDGAGDLRILVSIIMPMCLPGIVTAGVIAMIFAINEFLFTLLIASTANAYTLSVALANFSGGTDGTIFNAIALVSFIAFVPTFLVVVAIQGHLSRGLTMGAVKG